MRRFQLNVVSGPQTKKKQPPAANHLQPSFTIYSLIIPKFV